MSILRVNLGKLRRSKLGRKIEKNIRFPGKRFVSLGDTCSSFYRPGWETVDLVDADYILDFRKEPLPFGDEMIDAAYSSHVIEHISFDDGLKLFSEVYRCLKPGGVFRISTPDMDLLLSRYLSNDWRFFLQADGDYILRRVCKGILPPESLLIHNRLIGWFASYSGRLDTAGGPIVSPQLVEEKLNKLSKYQFRDWCVSLLEPGRIYAHIHLYDYNELYATLRKVGFSQVEKSEYGKSNNPVMLNPSIDSAKHKIYSLYVEAVK